MDIGIARFKPRICIMKGCGGLAGEQPCFREKKGPRTNGHSDICRFGDRSHPAQHGLCRRSLSRTHNDLWCWSGLKGVVGNDLHSPARRDRLERLSHGIGLEGVSVTWYVCGTEDLPRTAEVDNHCAVGDGKGYWDTAQLGRD